MYLHFIKMHFNKNIINATSLNFVLTLELLDNKYEIAEICIWIAYGWCNQSILREIWKLRFLFFMTQGFIYIMAQRDKHA